MALLQSLCSTGFETWDMGNGFLNLDLTRRKDGRLFQLFVKAENVSSPLSKEKFKSGKCI